MNREDIKNDQIVEDAADGLAAPDSQESDDNWSPNDLSPEQRQQYDRAVKAIDEFVTKHPEYKPTDENRQVILDYLESHDLAISPASLELCWEQLQDRLDWAEQRDSEQPDATMRVATAGLARGTRSEQEPPGTVEKEPAAEEEPMGRRGKPVVAWRNGRAVIGVGS